ELDARTPKLPPLSWITLPRSLGLYLHLNTGKWLCISGGTFNWPIKKVNNAASRLLSGVAINLLTVDKLINHLVIARVKLSKLIGLIVAQQEAITKEN